MITQNMKENHISNENSLVWDLYRYAKSSFFAICTRLNKLNLLFYIKIAIFGGNLGIFQNDVEAKPLDKKC